MIPDLDNLREDHPLDLLLHPKGWLRLLSKDFYIKIGKAGTYSGKRDIIVPEDHFNNSATLDTLLNISECGLRSTEWSQRCLLSVELC